jgi:hypothetical protein
MPRDVDRREAGHSDIARGDFITIDILITCREDELVAEILARLDRSTERRTEAIKEIGLQLRFTLLRFLRPNWN